jgi:hypothetical protein
VRSAKWQERNAALEEVEGILAAAGGRITPSVGNLVALLKVHASLLLPEHVISAMLSCWLQVVNSG